MRLLPLEVILVLATVTPPVSAAPIIFSNLTRIDPKEGGPDIAVVTSAGRFVAPATAWLTDFTIWSTEEHFNNQWHGTAAWSLFADAHNNWPMPTPSHSGVGLNPTRRLLFRERPEASINRQYTFTLDHPTLLTDGTTYWFSPLVAGRLIGWAGVTPDITGPVVQRWIGERDRLSIGNESLGSELHGQLPTPEPASLLLLATGLGSLLLTKKSRRRSP